MLQAITVKLRRKRRAMHDVFGIYIVAKVFRQRQHHVLRM